MTVTLVLGGARSGKSRHAESLCAGERHYIATAQAFDAEMHQRIAQHREARGANWVTHEVVLELAEKLLEIDGRGRTALVDCLTLWLTNLILAEADCQQQVNELAARLPSLKADVVLVSNEVGMGIVPDNALGRRFRDAQGLLNQRVAQAADRVIFVAAGLPLTLKG